MDQAVQVPSQRNWNKAFSVSKDDALAIASDNGHLAIAMWAHASGASDARAMAWALYRAGMRGHLNVVQWLCSIDDTNVDNAFEAACDHGHLATAQWLYAQGATVQREALESKLDAKMVKWLKSVKIIE